eukprot:scaffold6696_cov146-Isochrysis_galbana.AAC.1
MPLSAVADGRSLAAAACGRALVRHVWHLNRSRLVRAHGLATAERFLNLCVHMYVCANNHSEPSFAGRSNPPKICIEAADLPWARMRQILLRKRWMR